MAENPYSHTGAVSRAGARVDEGLRSHMIGVYNYMALGVAFTGLVAYMISSLATTGDASLAVAQLQNGKYLTQLGYTLYASPLKWVLMFAPLAFVLLLNFGVHRLSTSATHIAFWLFAAVMGISISSIFLIFTGQSITQIFFVSAAAFAGLSLWGYTTKKDISGWGSFLIMGVVGLIVAGIANIWLQSSALHFAGAALGVLIFAGLTAYHTQQIKDIYLQVRNDATLVAKSAILGALSLYIDFINLFMSLLQLLGNRE